MITFEEGEKRFTYRVAGIALDVDRVLLLRTEKDNFWFLLIPHILAEKVELDSSNHRAYCAHRCSGAKPLTPICPRTCYPEEGT